MLGGEDIITRFRGHPLRGHFWPVQPLDTATEGATDNGLVIICPGFTEFCEKHSGTCRALHERGFDVLVIDWPGHGRSGHFGRHPLAVHIDSFEIYLEAMDHLLTAAGLAARNDVFLFGHSMGGHLALQAGSASSPPCAWCHPVCADDSATGHAGCWCAAAGWLPLPAWLATVFSALSPCSDACQGAPVPPRQCAVGMAARF